MGSHVLKLNDGLPFIRKPVNINVSGSARDERGSDGGPWPQT